MPETFVIRKAEAADVDSVKNLEIDCGLSAWQIVDYKNEVKRKDSIFIVAEKEKRIVGFATARLIMKLDNNHLISKSNNNFDQFDQLEIYNIGVEKKYRQQRIGKSIFNQILNFSRETGIKEIWLEVRESNQTALKFYKNLGFSKAYTRKNFYTTPSEEAIVMMLEI